MKKVLIILMLIFAAVIILNISSAAAVLSLTQFKTNCNAGTYGTPAYWKSKSIGQQYTSVVCSPDICFKGYDSLYGEVLCTSFVGTGATITACCKSSCANECTSGVKQCLTSATLRTCGKYDADPCTEWSSAQSCAAGYVCESGNCIIQAPACTNECTASGSKICSGLTGYKTCGNYDTDSCLEWSSVTVCLSGQECLNGSCITPAPVACTDSDGGKDYNVKGTTTGIDWGTSDLVTKSDYCITEGEKVGRLAEFFCQDNQVASESYECPYGCLNGACKACTPKTCGDVREYPICGSFNNGCGGTIICGCPSGETCENEACKPAPATCRDSDGGLNPNIYGWTDFRLGSFQLKNEDECALVSSYDINGNPVNWMTDGYNFSCSGNDCYIQEAYCSVDANGNFNDADATKMIKCPNGCQNGACLSAPSGALYCNPNGVLVTLEECDPKGPIFKAGQNSCTALGYSGGTLKCTENCKVDTSLCTAAKPVTPLPSAGPCVDSDKLNLELKGTVTTAIGATTAAYTDSCVSKQVLKENYCSKGNLPKVKNYSCPKTYKCIDGACVK